MSLVYRLMILALLSVGTWAQAQIIVQDPHLRKDDTITAQVVVDGQAVPIRGNFQGGNPVVINAGGLITTITRYTGYISFAVVRSGRDEGSLYIFETDNKGKDQTEFVLRNQTPILDRAASLNDDLAGILKGLKDQQGWDATMVFPGVLEYFRSKPDAYLSDYLMEVQNYRVIALSPPKSKVQSAEPAEQEPVARNSDPTPAPSVDGGISDGQDDSGNSDLSRYYQDNSQQQQELQPKQKRHRKVPRYQQDPDESDNFPQPPSWDENSNDGYRPLPPLGRHMMPWDY